MVVLFFDHSELAHTDQLAQNAGCQQLPFTNVEKLVADTGERFFSEHLNWLKETKPTFGINDLCLFKSCSGKEQQQSVALSVPPVITRPKTSTATQPQHPPTNSTTNLHSTSFDGDDTNANDDSTTLFHATTTTTVLLFALQRALLQAGQARQTTP